MKRYYVKFNGSDSPVVFESNHYGEAAQAAIQHSLNDTGWGSHLGYAVYSADGVKRAVFVNGLMKGIA